LDISAIVLAGGFSSRFGQDKGVLKLAHKPLIKHVVDAVSPIVNEIIVVTSSQERITQYAKVMTADVQFRYAHGEYSLLLPFDTPFVSKEVVSLLFELCLNKSAAIPRWPNCQIEPLHAVYQTEPALEAARTAVAEGKLNLRAMIEKLTEVRYVSTLVIQQLDPQLRTFFNINTPADLKRAMAIVRPSTHS